MDFSQERILKKFSHNKNTGEITRKRNGRVVTSKDQDGYIVVADFENGKNNRMRGARLVWVMYNGDIPEGMVVDHINRNRTDNRIENLRLATTKENAANSVRHGDTYTSKFKGVQSDKHGRWIASIQSDGVTKRIGVYDSEEAAAYAYNTEASIRYGEFAVLNNVAPVDLDLYKTVKDRDYLTAQRRGLPKHLIVLKDNGDYLFRVDNSVVARFKPEHRDDALKFAEHYNNTGEELDLRTNAFKYNKFGLPYNVFPCSTGFRSSFLHDYKRYHVGSFRTEEQAVIALRRKQDEIMCEGK